MSWDLDYKKRGSLWGGASSELPNLPKDSLVLEVGCGNGKTLSEMRKRDWKTVGIDTSFEAVRLSGEDAFLGDVRSLPFSDETFDAIFCWHVLGHLRVSDFSIAVGELKRVIKKNGKIYFKEFSRGDLRFGKGFEVEPNSFLRGNGVVTHYFDECEVREVFGDGEITFISWSMRVLGEDLKREEICGVFGR